MNSDDMSGAVNHLLSPLMESAVGHVRAGAVDGFRLGVGLCVQTVDVYRERVRTFTAPEHVEAVTEILGSLASGMRELSAGFSIEE